MEQTTKPMSIKHLWTFTDRMGRKGYDMQIMFNWTLKKALGLHKCFIKFRMWTTFTDADGYHVAKRILIRINQYLKQLGVVAINNVVLAIKNLVNYTYVREVDEIPYGKGHEIMVDVNNSNE